MSRIPFATRFFLSLLVFFFSNRAAKSDESAMSVGRARTIITPKKPIRLIGYASRVTPFEGVLLDLEAKALALHDGTGKTSLILTLDLLGLPAKMNEQVVAKVMAKTGIPRERILVNSSHTHTGPHLALDDDDEPDWAPAHLQATREYTKELLEKLADLAIEATGKREPAKLSFGLGVTHFPMNRREFTDKGVILGVNPSGYADRSVPVLRVDSLEGKPLAIVFGATCHNTTLTPKDVHISGDFAGYSQKRIEAAFPGTQAMFVQGCSGDTNPYPRGEEAIARSHGNALGDEVLRVIGDPLRPVSGPIKAAYQHAKLPLDPRFATGNLDELEKLGPWEQFAVKGLRNLTKNGKPIPREYSAPIQVWQFGDDLTLVALSGEVVTGYVNLIQNAIGHKNLWVCGYSNDLFGYLPTGRVLEEGGYETRGLYAGSSGLFTPGAEKVVVDTVSSLANEVGRKK